MERLGRNVRQFIKFGMVGGSGVFVNLFVLYVCKKLSWRLAEITEYDAFMNLLGSQFHIRWYHVFMTIAFLVANTWNYQLNRMWTFKNITIGWFRGFIPFLTSGLLAFVISQIVMTLLMNETSPFALPTDVLDDSTGFRTKFYWASLIAIFFSMPANFILNKLWTFRKPKKPKVIVHTEPMAT